MHRSAVRQLLALVAVLVLLVPAAAPAPAAAITPTLSMTTFPASPAAPNVPLTFAATVTPMIEGAEVQFALGGAVLASGLTDAQGVATVELVLGPGTYWIGAVLVGGDGYDWAWSAGQELDVDPDPGRLPDAFSVSAWGRETLRAVGADAMAWVDRAASWEPNRLVVGASEVATGDLMGIGMLGPAGVPLAVGLYDPANGFTPAGEGAEVTVGGPWPGCGDPRAEGAFAILAIDRAPDGAVISITVVGEYRCRGAQWPTVGWIRYNDTTPVPSLSLPDASPYAASVTEGATGEPVAYPMTNDGEVPVDIDEIAISGPDAAAWDLVADTCSGATLDPGDGCSFSLVFAPATSGDKAAVVEIHSSLPVPVRRLPVVGRGLIATAIGAPVVTSTNAILNGLAYVSAFAPPTDTGSAECVVDGVAIGGGLSINEGVLGCAGPHPGPGTHAVWARYLGSHVHGASESPETVFTLDPATATTVHVDRPATNANVPVTAIATVEFQGDVAFHGGVLTIIDTATDEVLASGPVGPEVPSLVVTRTFAEGAHHLVAAYAGIDDVHDPSSGTADVVTTAPDTAAPAITAPTVGILATAVTDGSVPVRIAWSGNDAGSGVVAYEVRRRTGDGAWGPASTVVGTSIERGVVPGRRYRWSVRAVDAAGNVSAWARTPEVVPVHVADAAPAVRYAGRWRTVDGDDTPWWGGSVRASRDRGATATLTVVGRSIAWVAARGPNRGRAEIWVDGTLRATVDLRATSVEPQRIAWSRSWATSGSHRVVIRVLGTGGRPRVDLDAFVVLR